VGRHHPVAFRAVVVQKAHRRARPADLHSVR
jgi:hypothetical protein